MKEELKIMIFQAVENQFPLGDFESWLYKQEELSEQMSENLVLELYSFNYKQKDAKHTFKAVILPYFEKEEFMRWKIKVNLQDLINGRNVNDILSEFYWQLKDELPFLTNLSYSLFELDEIDYGYRSRIQVMESIKSEATLLLDELLEDERTNPEFAIYSFNKKAVSWIDTKMADAENSKKWWQLWK